MSVSHGSFDKIIRFFYVFKWSFPSGIQPCPYAVYRFFDFADHDTDIVQSTNTPEFNDVNTFPVPMTTELDTYLRAAVTSLRVYLFALCTVFCNTWAAENRLTLRHPFIM